MTFNITEGLSSTRAVLESDRLTSQDRISNIDPMMNILRELDVQNAGSRPINAQGMEALFTGRFACV